MIAATVGSPHGLNRNATTSPMIPLITESVTMVMIPMMANSSAAKASTTEETYKARLQIPVNSHKVSMTGATNTFKINFITIPSVSIYIVLEFMYGSKDVEDLCSPASFLFTPPLRALLKYRLPAPIAVPVCL